MRKTLIIDFMLGFALRYFQDQGDKRRAAYVEGVIAKKRARQDVDDHMQTVANLLAGDEPPDFDELTDRINAEVDELLARGRAQTEESNDADTNADDQNDSPDVVDGEDTHPDPEQPP